MSFSTTDVSSNSADLAALLLRLSTGGLFIAHALLKVIVFTPAGTVGYFQSLGLPGFLAYVTILVELLGGLALIAGWKVKLVAPVLTIVLLGAAYFGHAANGFFFMNPNGGWEFPVFWAVMMIVLTLIGSGKYAIDNRS